MRILRILDSMYCDISRRTDGTINIVPFYIITATTLLLIDFYFSGFSDEVSVIFLLFISAPISILFYLILWTNDFEFGKKRSFNSFYQKHKEEIEKEDREKYEKMRKEINELARELNIDERL